MKKIKAWNDSTGDEGILRRWTHTLPRRMQAVLCAAIRGCDGAPKNDPSKAVLWALRWDTMNPSDDHFDPRTTRSFMGYIPSLDACVTQMLGSLDQYPFHFVMHVLHAAEICGFHHPDPKRRVFWSEFYVTACHEHLHVTPETREQLRDRLRDR